MCQRLYHYYSKPTLGQYLHKGRVLRYAIDGSFSQGRAALPTWRLAGKMISCPRTFQNALLAPRTYANVLNHATLRRAPRGRPDLAGYLPRCVRTDGRVEVCAISVPTLIEPRTFGKCVLKEEHSNQAPGHDAGI